MSDREQERLTNEEKVVTATRLMPLRQGSVHRQSLTMSNSFQKDFYRCRIAPYQFQGIGCLPL